jgi:hypothetical protein
VTGSLHVVDQAPRAVAPRPTQPAHDTPYYRNVELSVRDGHFTVVDASGRPHPLPASAIAWVAAGTKTRLLVLDQAGVVLAELPPDGWDVAELAAFGDEVGVPLVEKLFDDPLGAQGAYPLPKGALRVHAKELRTVLVQFLPVLLPVLVIIVLALVFG